MRAASGFIALLILASGTAFCQTPASEPALLQVLRSDAPLERKADACRQLAQVGTKDAVPTLVPLLSDEKLAHYARIALEQIPAPEADQALREAIPKLRGRLLAGALMSLSVRASRKPPRDTKSEADILGHHLRSADPDVAGAAAYALGRLGTPQAAHHIEQALEAAPDSLKPALRDAALRCAGVLMERGSSRDAIRIYDRLRDSDAPPFVRSGAARGAVLARKRGGIPLLVAMLQESDQALFQTALELTQIVPGSEATRSIARTLPKLPVQRQPLVIAALGARGDRAAIPEIRAAAGKSDPDIRIAAIQALSQMGDASSLPLFIEAAAGTDSDLRSAAAAAIVRLPGKSVDDSLIALLSGPDAGKARVAIEALSRRQTAAATPALLRAAASGPEPVRLAALKALGRLSAASDLPEMVGLLVRAPSDSEREAAEEALAAVCSAAAQPDACAAALAAPLEQAGPEQKKALLRVLGTVGGSRALQLVRGAVRSADTDVRDTAVRALAGWGTPDAAPDLLALARESDSSTHRLLALRGYIRLAADETLPIDRRLAMCREARALIDRDDEMRQWVATLGTIPSPDALALIAPLIGSSGVNEEACSATAAVAGRLLASQSPAGLKPRLAEIAAVIEKALANTKSGQLSAALRRLGERVRQLQTQG